MSIERHTRPSGKVRYRARVKWHGSHVASRMFDRRVDAVTWHNEQLRRLQLGEWVDPSRGRVPLSAVAEGWLKTRSALKRRTAESDAAAWRLYIEPRYGKRPVNSFSSAELHEWTGSLISRGLAPATVTRALSTMRSLLQHAVADGRITINAAAAVPRPRGRARREGHGLDEFQIAALAAACEGPYAELVTVLAYTGLRWGELAGLRAADLVQLPGPGLRVERALLASNGGGALYTDTVKSGRARTVPLVSGVVPIVHRWADGKGASDSLFHAPAGGYLRESNWKRSIHWNDAKVTVGLPELRVHDLRHSAATIWLAGGADPKVVQRVLGHATATMTMDLYGHLIDASLWDAARRIGDASGTSQRASGDTTGTRIAETIEPKWRRL